MSMHSDMIYEAYQAELDCLRDELEKYKELEKAVRLMNHLYLTQPIQKALAELQESDDEIKICN